jgi:hypothetical protein
LVRVVACSKWKGASPALADRQSAGLNHRPADGRDVAGLFEGAAEGAEVLEGVEGEGVGGGALGFEVLDEGLAAGESGVGGAGGVGLAAGFEEAIGVERHVIVVDVGGVEAIARTEIARCLRAGRVAIADELIDLSLSEDGLFRGGVGDGQVGEGRRPFQARAPGLQGGRGGIGSGISRGSGGETDHVGIEQPAFVVDGVGVAADDGVGGGGELGGVKAAMGVVFRLVVPATLASRGMRKCLFQRARLTYWPPRAGLVVELTAEARQET